MKRFGKTLNYKVRQQIYIQLQQHPKYDSLRERVQDVVDCLAAGGTLVSLAAEWHVTDSMTWILRNCAFRDLGYTVFENGKRRTMTTHEVFLRMGLCRVCGKPLPDGAPRYNDHLAFEDTKEAGPICLSDAKNEPDELHLRYRKEFKS